MAYIRAIEKEETYITCEIAGLNSDYIYSDRYVVWYYNDEKKGISYIGAQVSSGGEFTATRLTPGTRYHIEARIYSDKGLITTLTGIATTKEKLIPPFYWTYSGAKNGNPVHGNRKISGMEFYVSAREWNELADNVKEKLEKRGMDTSQYYFGRIYAAVGDNFTATRFNYMRQAIGALSSTGLGNKSRGDIIRADDLNILMDCINQVS